MKVELSPETIQALLALCDSVPLRGPESKIVVAGAQAALLEALRQDQGRGPAEGRSCPVTLREAKGLAEPDSSLHSE